MGKLREDRYKNIRKSETIDPKEVEKPLIGRMIKNKEGNFIFVESKRGNVRIKQ